MLVGLACAGRRVVDNDDDTDNDHVGGADGSSTNEHLYFRSVSPG